jgi:hypothetical protein
MKNETKGGEVKFSMYIRMDGKNNNFVLQIITMLEDFSSFFFHEFSKTTNEGFFLCHFSFSRNSG